MVSLRAFLLLAETVVAVSLKPRDWFGPTAISIPPSQSWTGNDGPWSSFTLRVGTPAQKVGVLISTAGFETWVVTPEGCTHNDPPDCPTLRGGLYDNSASSTWQPQNFHPLGLESVLGYSSGGEYGFDTVGLGWQESGPVLTHQVVAGMATSEFYLGTFGISPGPSNLSDPSGQKSSFLVGLKQNGTIPSLSWGYTAGARYRLSKVLGSLTLGGYDLSRFTPNNLTFPFGIGNSDDLTVGIQSITMSSSDEQDTPLLPNPILAFIDSTIPHLWLPKEACAKFESAFGLTWDNASQLYLVDDKLHSSLLAKNPSVTFKLSLASKGGPSIDIVLPYAAFDLEVESPLLKRPTKYFPLKRAENDTQYTLGRTFLQEA
ncbi:hypothetical protein GP486_004474 [Trichoglossum hirsutum]|uniref:Peptidase A1 domain-containing protein n=1 Tax=Trichoglossum hirsutum TaxID=265104 RepID=A0A9P8LAX1_9PEZI|nr:hypothetical protein GP486_004474 [Trichoglossum hirsutum]